MQRRLQGMKPILSPNTNMMWYVCPRTAQGDGIQPPPCPATRLAPLLSLSLTHTHARTDTNTAACEITPLHKVEQSCHIWPKCMFMILPGWQTHLLTDYLWRFFSSTVQRVSARPHPGESFVILLCFNSCWKARGNTCIWKTYIYITHWYLHTHNGKMIVLWHFVRVEFIYDTLIGSSIC